MDELTIALEDIGHSLSDGFVPDARIGVLADAAAPVAPAAAAVLVSPAEPEVARLRAFARVSAVVADLGGSARQVLLDLLHSDAGSGREPWMVPGELMHVPERS